MHDWSKEVLIHFLVRKNNKQKETFLHRTKEVFEKEGYSVTIEEDGRFIKSRNLIVGNVKQAKVIYTAHYDTCAVMPIPNIITPRNLLFFILYQLLIVVVILGVGGLLGIIIGMLLNNWLNPDFVGIISTTLFALLFSVQLMFGKANKNTYNDNTSGVITLIEIAMNLPLEHRSKAAFVFFDNEELGLIGSSYFKKKYKSLLSGKLIVNFDCVSDGNHFLVIANKSVRRDKELYTIIKDMKSLDSYKKVKHVSSGTTFYPSDNMNFQKNIAIAAFHKKPFIGYYMGRIHTWRDVIFDERNIKFITESMIRITKRI